jgi:hypothetical protein
LQASPQTGTAAGRTLLLGYHRRADLLQVGFGTSLPAHD